MEIFQDESFPWQTRIFKMCERVDQITNQIRIIDPHIHQMNNKIAEILEALNKSGFSQEMCSESAQKQNSEFEVFTGIESRFLQSLWSVEKKHYELVRVTSQQAELVTKRIETISHEKDIQFNYKRKYERLKNTVDLLQIQFIKEKLNNSKIVQDQGDLALSLANELNQVKSQQSSYAKQNEFVEYQKTVSAKFLATETFNEVNKRLEQRMLQVVQDKATKFELNALKAELEELSGHNLGQTILSAERVVNSIIDTKMINYADKNLVQSQYKQIQNLKEEITKLVKQGLGELKDNIKQLDTKVLKDAKINSQKTQLQIEDCQKDFSLQLQMLEKNSVPQQQRGFSPQQKKEYISQIDNYNINNTKILEDLKSYNEQTYMTRLKGSDVLFRLCSLEDQFKTIYLTSSMIQPQMDRLKELLANVTLEGKRAADSLKSQEQETNNQQAKILELNCKIDAKLEKTEIQQSYEGKQAQQNLHSFNLNSLQQLESFKDFMLNIVGIQEQSYRYSIQNKQNGLNKTNHINFTKERFNQKLILLNKSQKITEQLKRLNLSTNQTVQNFTLDDMDYQDYNQNHQSTFRPRSGIRTRENRYQIDDLTRIPSTMVSRQVTSRPSSQRISKRGFSATTRQPLKTSYSQNRLKLSLSIQPQITQNFDPEISPLVKQADYQRAVSQQGTRQISRKKQTNQRIKLF